MKYTVITRIDVEVANECTLTNASALGNDVLVEQMENVKNNGYDLDEDGYRIW